MSEKLEESQLPLASPTGNSEEDQSEYVDLAPIDKADQSGIYSEALFDAVENPNVFNIALTGPYGSGKSSIIRTFLKNYDNYRFSENTVLQISLAAFLPESRPGKENDTKREKTHQSESVSKQEIERSILQQMLYGADANSLPLSRFKRIQSPRKLWSQIIALLIVFGVVSCWYLLQNQEVIFDRSFYQSHDQINWFNIICAALGAGFVWQILYQLYIKSFGISLKSISLKDIEIEPEAAREDSILNRHLDEIIYFFQCTNYELVVIEDLDRFNNPDIFVTLREINSLINANAGVDRQIRFLYALRDNMFDDTDRTKFFEFIIPVIPIINSSNSIDKMIEQEKRLCLPKRLDSQFLKEVSRYLNDLRLIQNIFNEYTIYRKNLGTVEENSLDPHKLLAVLIYKNVLPSDFEELHRDRGNFAKILSQREHFITKQEASFKSDISVLEKEIKASENQFANNLDELRKIYVATLIAQMPEGYSY
ncbi:hypothetical protein, partial [Thalassospira sp.]|uniref:YobI family P-loop NTPase n=1 Tax=Thalassospira sp. TaxID=1912094 RepID=UPI00311DA846